MFSISSWVMSIVGIVIMTLIVDIIIPEGQTNKYIKSIFSLLTVFVIASPIPNLIKSDFDLTEVFAPPESIVIDDGFLAKIYSDRIDVLIDKAQTALAGAGILKAKVSIVADNVSNYPKIVKVLINLENIVIINKPSNININEYVTQTLTVALEINADMVVVL